MQEHDKRVLLLAIGVCLFLAAVDQTIISTALPSILDQIGSIKDVSLIMNSYLVASVTFGPTYGKLSDVFGRRNGLPGYSWGCLHPWQLPPKNKDFC